MYTRATYARISIIDFFICGFLIRSPRRGDRTVNRNHQLKKNARLSFCIMTCSILMWIHNKNKKCAYYLKIIKKKYLLKANENKICT